MSDSEGSVIVEGEQNECEDLWEDGMLGTYFQVEDGERKSR